MADAEHDDEQAPSDLKTLNDGIAALQQLQKQLGEIMEGLQGSDATLTDHTTDFLKAANTTATYGLAFGRACTKYKAKLDELAGKERRLDENTRHHHRHDPISTNLCFLARQIRGSFPQLEDAKRTNTALSTIHEEKIQELSEAKGRAEAKVNDAGLRDQTPGLEASRELERLREEIKALKAKDDTAEEVYKALWDCRDPSDVDSLRNELANFLKVPQPNPLSPEEPEAAPTTGIKKRRLLSFPFGGREATASAKSSTRKINPIRKSPRTQATAFTLSSRSSAQTPPTQLQPTQTQSSQSTTQADVPMGGMETFTNDPALVGSRSYVIIPYRNLEDLENSIINATAMSHIQSTRPPLDWKGVEPRIDKCRARNNTATPCCLGHSCTSQGCGWTPEQYENNAVCKNCLRKTDNKLWGKVKEPGDKMQCFKVPDVPGQLWLLNPQPDDMRRQHAYDRQNGFHGSGGNENSRDDPPRRTSQGNNDNDNDSSHDSGDNLPKVGQEGSGVFSQIISHVQDGAHSMVSKVTSPLRSRRSFRTIRSHTSAETVRGANAQQQGEDWPLQSRGAQSTQKGPRSDIRSFSSSTRSSSSRISPENPEPGSAVENLKKIMEQYSEGRAQQAYAQAKADGLSEHECKKIFRQVKQKAKSHMASETGREAGKDKGPYDLTPPTEKTEGALSPHEGSRAQQQQTPTKPTKSSALSVKSFASRSSLKPSSNVFGKSSTRERERQSFANGSSLSLTTRPKDKGGDLSMTGSSNNQNGGKVRQSFGQRSFHASRA